VKANLIDGHWIQAADVRPNISPSDLSDVIDTYSQGSSEDTQRAVAAAHAAGALWRATTSQERSDFLDRVGTEILSRKDALGRLLSREEGKTLSEGIAEVVRAGQIFKFFAGEALRMSGEALASTRSGVDVEVLREPVGVVALITPWNFPMAIPAWKLAPALAYGNTVVMKPADLTPGSVHALAEIMIHCGLPPGVFNLVMGRGQVVGNALIEHPQVAAVSFTGSVEVGRDLIARCAARQIKIQAEMGGKNPTVIMGDADLNIAIPACINAAFGSTGQRCTATSRLIVHANILEEFSQRFIKAATALKVGHSLETDTQVGPVASEAQLARNLDYVSLAREEGATVVGGEVVERGTRGYFQTPAIFLNASNTMRISQEEIFGPCVAIIAADSFEHALTLANTTPFGLSSGICTTNLKYAREFIKRSRSGMVMVNLPTAGVDYHVPFGGTKGSSYGPREQGRSAIDFYTTSKTTYTLA
jgi:aldehyde dehydrogenase (NAD+)